jgi:hypothetical protein
MCAVGVRSGMAGGRNRQCNAAHARAEVAYRGGTLVRKGVRRAWSQRMRWRCTIGWWMAAHAGESRDQKRGDALCGAPDCEISSSLSTMTPVRPLRKARLMTQQQMSRR